MSIISFYLIPVTINSFGSLKSSSLKNDSSLENYLLIQTNGFLYYLKKYPLTYSLLRGCFGRKPGKSGFVFLFNLENKPLFYLQILGHFFFLSTLPKSQFYNLLVQFYKYQIKILQNHQNKCKE